MNLQMDCIFLNILSITPSQLKFLIGYKETFAITETILNINQAAICNIVNNSITTDFDNSFEGYINKVVGLQQMSYNISTAVKLINDHDFVNTTPSMNGIASANDLKVTMFDDYSNIDILLDNNSSLCTLLEELQDTVLEYTYNFISKNAPKYIYRYIYRYICFMQMYLFLYIFNMIEKYKITTSKKDKDSLYRNCHIRSFKFTKGLNLILGGNTSGKTTTIRNLRRYLETNELNNQEIIEAKITGEVVPYIYYDSIMYKEGNSFSDNDSFEFAIRSKFMSRGETTLNYHSVFFDMLQIDINKYGGNIVLLADEPEEGLSLNMQFTLLRWFLRISKKYPDMQIIISSHSIAAMILSLNEDVNTIHLSTKQFRDDMLKLINDKDYFKL